MDAKRKNNIFFFSNFAVNPRLSCGTTGIDRNVNAAMNLRANVILELNAAGRSFVPFYTLFVPSNHV